MLGSSPARTAIFKSFHVYLIMSLNVTPIGDKVLVSRVIQEKIGSFHVPENYQRTGNGRVEAVGPEVTEVKVGDEVVLPNQTGLLVKIDDVDYGLFREKEIMAIVNA